MCGIIGYIGEKKASRIVFEGLKHLQYRGYDSVGIATVSNSKIFVKKDKGKIDEVNERLNFFDLEGNLAIGHTRWATHGKVSRENAHPHLDCQGKIAIVHNGIIENFLSLRESLEAKGHKFKSETDSEVVAHLIEEFMKEFEFEEACKRAFSNLEGSFAILAIFSEKEEIVGIRKDSPLVVGLNENEAFVSSDIYALLPYTENFIFLQNYDFVILGQKFAKIENLFEGKVERPLEKISVEFENKGKENFHHFMIKEILEQADIFERAFKQEEEKIEKLVEELKSCKKIFLVGAGTSFHASLAFSLLLAKASIFSLPIIASEFKNYENLLDENSLLIAISQSGETADVLEAVRIAKKKGAKVFSIVNVYGSSLARESDEFMLMKAGFEVGVAATKTYTAELAIALKIYSKICGTKINPIEIKAKILDLLSRSRREFIQRIAEKIKDKKSVFLIGRGLEQVTALEAALKIKEISYIHAEAFPGGELKHGTLALIEKDVPCFVFVSKERKEEILSNAYEVKARGGFIIGVASKKEEIFDFWIKTPEAREEENLVLQIIPMQLLAYETAVLRNCDPDKPRNLSKSVTVK